MRILALCAFLAMGVFLSSATAYAADIVACWEEADNAAGTTRTITTTTWSAQTFIVNQDVMVDLVAIDTANTGSSGSVDVTMYITGTTGATYTPNMSDIIATSTESKNQNAGGGGFDCEADPFLEADQWDFTPFQLTINKHYAIVVKADFASTRIPRWQTSDSTSGLIAGQAPWESVDSGANWSCIAQNCASFGTGGVPDNWDYYFAVLGVGGALPYVPPTPGPYPGDFVYEQITGNVYGTERGLDPLNNTAQIILSELDPSHLYIFTMQSVDENDSPIVTLDTQYLIGESNHVLTMPVPHDFVGIVRITADNYGHVLSRFIVAQRATEYLTNGLPSFGVAIGKAEGDSIHNVPLDTNGFRHIKFPTQITDQGFYGYLHFILDNASASDYIVVSHVNGAEVARISVDDVRFYNYNNSISFVAINTSGAVLPFIDPVHDAISWIYGDNPHTLSLDSGMYEYAIVNSSNVVQKAGDDIWIVTPSYQDTLMAIHNIEEVRVSRKQIVKILWFCEACWTDYPNQYLFDQAENINPILIDNVEHAYAATRNITYTVDDTVENNVEILYRRTADSLKYGQNPSHFIFEIESVYNILEQGTLTGSIKAGLNALPFAYDIALLLLFLILNAVTFAACYSTHQGAAVYAIVFVAWAAAFIFSTLITPLTLLFIAFAVIISAIMVLQGRDKYA